MRTPLASPVPRRSWEELVEHIRAGGPALVALSGGVDSGLVAAAAHGSAGAGTLAVTLQGPAVSASEVDRARRVAATIGIPHAVLDVDPVAREEYRSNPSNRCYFCRSFESATLTAFGSERGIRQYLDGVHLDDLSDDRPGLRALDEAGFLHPLLWAGWRKSDVRAAARERGLPNWDAPSDACLASRIAHGEPISRELLAKVEAAEALVRNRGFRQVRVRVRDGRARIEVDPDEVSRLLAAPLAGEVAEAVRAVGFRTVEIDPVGYGGPRRSPSAVA
jgi:pyridinium-3,5-biscarboxylic acid mononucleotide sulfurtransferase